MRALSERRACRIAAAQLGDASSKNWEALPASDRNPIRESIRVARKLTTPNLLTLPLPTAVAAK